MKKFWFILVILLGLTNRLALAEVCSKLTLTGPPNSAPSSWTSDGKLIGAAVEYAETISRASGIKQVEFRAFPTWSQALQAVYRGEVDVIFSANWSEERERYLDYIRPHMSSQFLNVVVRRGEAFDLNKLEDLASRPGASPAGDAYGDGHFGTFVKKSLQLQKAENTGKAVDLLLEKKVDYVFGYEDAIFSQLASRNLGSALQILNTYPTRAEGFIAFSKRSLCGLALRERFADQVALANANHTFRALMIKYREVFNESLTRPK
ncbi:MAG: transporter substrate-binding domain-containing protein [Alcaligenaceae bacterium]